MSLWDDMSAAEKRFEVETALATVLASLPRTAPTSVVAAKVGRILDVPSNEVAGPIVKLAYAGHPQARKGATFKRFGRTMQRWVWEPTGSGQPAAPPAPAEGWTE